MFGKSEEQKMFEEKDNLDKEVERVKASGSDPSSLEEFAKTLRMMSYSYRGLSRRTMVEVIKSHDPRALEEWNGLWEEMKQGTLHPRKLKAFYERVKARNDY